MQVRNRPWWHYVLPLLCVAAVIFAVAVVAPSAVDKDDDDIHILPGKRSRPSPAAFYNCSDILDDEQFAGLRLVESQSFGSGADLCHLAPADQPTAAATEQQPVVGKRVEVRHADGAVTASDFAFTRGAIDPGDDGPVVIPR